MITCVEAGAQVKHLSLSFRTLFFETEFSSLNCELAISAILVGQ